MRAGLWMLGSVLAATAASGEAPAPVPVPRPLPVVLTGEPPPARPVLLPEARWDGRAGAEGWTLAALMALAETPRDLRDAVPADIGAWCPAYAANSGDLRAAFWVGALSALALHESRYDEGAVGGGGAWLGLFQISPATARSAGCGAEAAALRDGAVNAACAVRLAARAVARDGVVAEGGGLAAEWGPLRRPEVAEDVRAWVRGRDYCQRRAAPAAGLRPPARG